MDSMLVKLSLLGKLFGKLLFDAAAENAAAENAAAENGSPYLSLFGPIIILSILLYKTFSKYDFGERIDIYIYRVRII